MHNAAGDGTSGSSHDRIERDDSIVSDLVLLMERVQASMKLIESTLAREAPLGNQETAANVVILDDVTPRYVRANAALYSSNASLGAAIHFLRDTGTVKHRTEGAGLGYLPVRSTGRG